MSSPMDERCQSRGLQGEAAADAADLGEYLAGFGTSLAVKLTNLALFSGGGGAFR